MAQGIQSCLEKRLVKSKHVVRIINFYSVLYYRGKLAPKQFQFLDSQLLLSQAQKYNISSEG